MAGPTTPWRMPAEWTPHERTWMAWPSNGYTLGDTPEEIDSARSTWAAVARAVARFEPVTMVVAPSDIHRCREYLRNDTAHPIDIVIADLDDAWMRDIGPTFVLSPTGELGGVDWIFNGWGAQEWATWDLDARIASRVADAAGAHHLPSSIVNEGGGIHVDGEGTVLLTETVQLDPGRNPSATKGDIEAEIGRQLGVDTFVWLPRGLTRDYDEFGTRGHVDIVATFTAPGHVLLHWQGDESHPDHAVSREIEAVLLAARDSAGRPLEVTRIPAPQTLTDDEGPVDWSYVNHLVCNGGVVACVFDDPHDERALEVLRSVYPGRQVVGVDARPLFDRGGGIHCITQQQPESS